MKNDNLIFIDTPQWGILRYHNVYAFYDEPIMFSALNQYGHLYFCYSLGCDYDDGHDHWIVIPLSIDKLNRFEQKDVSISGLINQSLKENAAFLLKINLASLNNSYSQISEQEFNQVYFLPDDNLFIHQNVNFDGKRAFSHRIRIAVKDKSKQTITVINKISELFGSIAKQIPDVISGIKSDFILKDAVPGSYVQRVHARLESKKIFDKSEQTSLFNDSFSVLLDSDRISSLSDGKLLKDINELFFQLRKNKAKIQFFDEESTESILDLDYQYIDTLHSIISEKLENLLDSSIIPQANSLDKVKAYIDLLAKKHVVLPEDLGIDNRQVLYYRDACKILGLVERDYLTPQGKRVAALTEQNEWLAIIKNQFENSFCGYLWMKYADVSSITEIQDEQSAISFLKEKSTGLSENTSERRAKTLITWLKAFKQLPA